MEDLLFALDEFKGLSEILLMINLIALFQFFRELRHFGRKLYSLEKSQQQPINIHFSDSPIDTNNRSTLYEPVPQKVETIQPEVKTPPSQSPAPIKSSQPKVEKKFEPKKKSATKILECPKCKAENSPYRKSCYRCNAKLN